MSKLSLASFLILPLFFSGCMEFLNHQKPVPSKKIVAQPQIQLKEQAIKGVIDDLVYSDDGWCYSIRSVDTANNKLQSGRFCAEKHYFSIGDLVYATIIGDKIKNMLLIRKEYLKSHDSYRGLDLKKAGKSPSKRTENRKNSIEIPKTEKISFD